MVSPSSGKKQKSRQNKQKKTEKHYINGFQPAPKDIKGV